MSGNPAKLKHDSATQKARSLKSPWRKGPTCDTGRAKASYINYRKKGRVSHEDHQHSDHAGR